MTQEVIEKRSAEKELENAVKKPKIGGKKSITDFFQKSSSTEKTKIVREEKTKEKTEEKTEEPENSPVPEITFDDDKLSDFKKKFITKLTEEQKHLLSLEINTIEDSWFEVLSDEFLKPYFLSLKKFLITQKTAKHTIFPPENDIYSWSRLTPLNKVKVIILGQDPYHNHNQAHGLAFSVKSPTPPPPSLKNMYKALKIDYPDFQIPTGTSSGDLTKWADRGVLMLNACLTVKAHEANSHAKKGWEQFTEVVLKKAISNDRKIVLLLWGTPAQKRITNIKINKDKIHVLTSVHPSPLSARRGYFEANHYIKANEWLIEQGEDPIDWSLVDGNSIEYHKK
ncbi:hypothetical protein BN7_361 [Wickerhamomyces ciferrii]|uniref:Uracil-DNA glycosylase n=1 Tax=Wickerhamomyces ciferrii (strain ATCC 14091 / BCRC 22168 / CBS 111 / JCM 3599 / NBRC 0793 / NRRL Y-1031 F-60-10) TaxID=1206466 RepID=K0KF39_WICCF|nr:uncharacterized protein BN7_361 [Wickerhamomyces ciferrii]CCH40827.1 hypothetical protein BN7_361 [Wickerhamomyces ciferrii]